jgi:hypothetical protein
MSHHMIDRWPTDPQLEAALRRLDKQVSPDPAFAERLYDLLDRRARQRPRGRLNLLAAAALLVALGGATVIGIGGLRNDDQAVVVPPLTPKPNPTQDDQAPPSPLLQGGSLLHTGSERISATLLDDGRVLIQTPRANFGSPTVTGELFDPARGGSETTGALLHARYAATATLLADGRVLFVGGFGGFAYPSTAVDVAEVWDPATGTFEEAGVSADARVGHTATLLQDGRVLVAGGLGPTGDLASAEIWDPATQTFSRTGSLAAARGSATATLLSDGRVAIAGGRGTTSATMSVETWDPTSGTFTTAGELVEPRVVHTATLLPDGRVLVVGGYAGNGFGTSTDDRGRQILVDASGRRIVDPDVLAEIAAGFVATAEIWDPATGVSTATGPLSTGRFQHTATLLSDGRVAVLGGQGFEVDEGALAPMALSSVEIWDPSTGAFSAARQLQRPRMAHAALLGPGDQVLVIGGDVDLAAPSESNVEVWTPDVTR